VYVGYIDLVHGHKPKNIREQHPVDVPISLWSVDENVEGAADDNQPI
jgi:hypothetical protein